MNQLIRNARLFQPTATGFQITENATIAIRDGHFADSHAPDAEEIDAVGRLLTPGLVDCHTHLTYAGSRANEFEARLEGATYAEIAQQGGGILSTVAATRAASLEELRIQLAARVERLRETGVTTVDLKSGYGLDLETERKLLQAAQACPIRHRRGYLGLHAVPPEFAGDAEGYVDWVISTVLPTLAAENLIDYVDAFGESIAFSPAQCRRVFFAAKALGLPIRMHADQLSDQNGGALAAEVGALSADHVEYTQPESVSAMARAGTVAVLLPGAFFFLRETQSPPVSRFREAGVPMAVATDANPGSSPLLSMPIAMTMACVQFGMTVAEVWAGATVVAAQAMGLSTEVGQIRAGFAADWVLWEADHPREVVAGIGQIAPWRVSSA